MTEPKTTETADDTSPAGLRATIERLEAKLAKANGIIRDQAFEMAGIDPSKGIGKAVAATFQGEPSKAAILKYAKDEYDFAPPTEPTTPKENETSAEAKLVETAQATADAAAAGTTGGGQALPPDLDAQIAAAEAAGDWNRSLELKSRKSNPLYKE